MASFSRFVTLKAADAGKASFGLSALGVCSTIIFGLEYTVDCDGWMEPPERVSLPADFENVDLDDLAQLIGMYLPSTRSIIPPLTDIKYSQ